MVISQPYRKRQGSHTISSLRLQASYAPKHTSAQTALVIMEIHSAPVNTDMVLH